MNLCFEEKHVQKCDVDDEGSLLRAISLRTPLTVTLGENVWNASLMSDCPLTVPSKRAQFEWQVGNLLLEHP